MDMIRTDISTSINTLKDAITIAARNLSICSRIYIFCTRYIPYCTLIAIYFHQAFSGVICRPSFTIHNLVCWIILHLLCQNCCHTQTKKNNNKKTKSLFFHIAKSKLPSNSPIQALILSFRFGKRRRSLFLRTHPFVQVCCITTVERLKFVKFELTDR